MKEWHERAAFVICEELGHGGGYIQQKIKDYLDEYDPGTAAEGGPVLKTEWGELVARADAAFAPLRAENESLRKALEGLLPLAEWALMEQSPPGCDQPLVDAARAALAEKEGK